VRHVVLRQASMRFLSQSFTMQSTTR
jgi:hypothetical protein